MTYKRIKNAKKIKSKKVKDFIDSCKFDKQTFINNLCEILSDNNIMHSVFANSIGVSSQSFSNWLTYQNNKLPNWVETLYRLDKYLTENVDYYNFKSLFDTKFNLNELKESHTSQQEYQMRLTKLKESYNLSDDKILQILEAYCSQIKT